jgi:uncharacterized protein (TIGR01244 family)
MKIVSIACLILSAAALGLHCAGTEPPQSAAGDAPFVAIRDAATPLEGILTAGQPTPAQIDEVAAAGYRTVINLRTAGEEGFAWEPAAVEAAGMRYVLLPVGKEGLTRANVERLDEELAGGLQEGPVLLHCASSNRVGALLALRARWLQGASPQEALELGLAGGMTRLEPAVTELLTRE